MWAIDWNEMGCTQYASTLEDAHKIGQRGGPFYIITYLGGPKDDGIKEEHKAAGV
jgi:hypothetical protein